MFGINRRNGIELETKERKRQRKERKSQKKKTSIIELEKEGFPSCFRLSSRSHFLVFSSFLDFLPFNFNFTRRFPFRDFLLVEIQVGRFQGRFPFRNRSIITMSKDKTQSWFYCFFVKDFLLCISLDWSD